MLILMKVQYLVWIFLFQDIIRASMIPDQSLTQKQSTTPSLVIKLPIQTEERRENSSFPAAPEGEPDNESAEEEEEEDDWDTFQSFPPPVNEDASASPATEEPSLTENLSLSDNKAENSDIEEQSSSKPSGEVSRVAVAGKVDSEEGLMIGSEVDGKQTAEIRDSEHERLSIDHQDGIEEESNKEMSSGTENSIPIEDDDEVADKDHELFQNTCLSTDQQDCLPDESHKPVPDETKIQSLSEHVEEIQESCDAEESKLKPDSENKQSSSNIQHIEESDSYNEHSPSNRADGSHPSSRQSSSDLQSAHSTEHPDHDHPEDEGNIHDRTSSDSTHDGKEQKTDLVEWFIYETAPTL